MDPIEKMLQASVEEIKKGYVEAEAYYECLLCGEKTEKGVIYQCGEKLYEAERYLKHHIEETHGSVFEYLIGLDKKTTGLSEHQNGLLKLFYQGKSDAEVQKEMGIGSSSTIRNHRFVLKEKERQAKVFLVLMELLKATGKKSSGLVSPHKTAKMVDDRYKITEEESDKVLMKYFPQGLNGQLKTFDMREKSKIVVLRHLAKRFTENRIYSEKEINEVLKSAYFDFATLRRYMIQYGFMDRRPDGSQYWLRKEESEKEVEIMDRKKELVQQYKEMKREAGVFQIRNIKNNKVFVLSTPELKSINGRRFELQMGGYRNKALQNDWNQYGEEAFVFEVLEVLEEKEGVYYDINDELKKLEAKWLEKLKPYGEKGYNKEK